MKQKFLPIMRLALPALGALALALVFALSSIPANADTASSANLVECRGMICDPADCPMPCADQCSGVKSGKCDMQKMCAKQVEHSPMKTTASATGCEPCPIPCAQKCTGDSK